MTFDKKVEPISQDALDLLQQFLGFKLPNEYIEFLRFSGGARIYQNTYSPINQEERVSIDCLYGLNQTDHNYDFVYHLKLYAARIPSHFITIGDDGGGNQICLGVKGPDRNKVYLWDHEFEADDGETPTKENMTLITHSFTDFINNLFERNYDE
jgi:hypothetical protein